MRRQQGYALPVALAVVAVIGIVITMLADRVDTAREAAAARQRIADGVIAMSSARAEMLYRLATNPVSPRGLGIDPTAVVRMDGRWYRDPGGALTAVQDNRGLLNLNYVADDRLLRLFTLLEVPPDQHARLLDNLRDYIDEDDLMRLNGAEKRQYEEAGLPPPRNSQLVTPFEARSILAWRERPEFWQDDKLLKLINTNPAIGLNVNTASKDVLRTMPYLTEEMVDLLLKLRETGPIQAESHLPGLIGISPSLALSQFSVWPADSVRVTHMQPGLPWAMQYNLLFTPQSDSAPWRIDYAYRTAKPTLSESPERFPPLPPLPGPDHPAAAPSPAAPERVPTR